MPVSVQKDGTDLSVTRRAATGADSPASTAAGTSTADPLHTKHVLVIGINYAPEPTGIAPYTTGMAEHLATRAESVTVMTGLPHYPSWRVNETYRGRRHTYEHPADGAGPTLLRLSHHVPARQTALTRARYEATFLLNALTTTPPRRPDLVVAVTPSLGGAVAGARIARRYGVPLIVVVQDLMGRAAGQSGIRGGGLVSGITSTLEAYALRHASKVAVISEAFRSAVTACGVPDERVTVLPNWTHIAPAGEDHLAARSTLGWPTGAFIVAHTGNMGLKQDLGTVVEAARRLPGKADFVFVGDGNQRAEIEAQAAGLANVRFVDPLDDDHYPLALAAADVLLVNERPSVGDMSLPSKLTSYLCAGRPVLAAAAQDGATAAELHRAKGAALVVRPGDPRVLAEAVLELRADSALRRQMSQAGLDYARSRLNRAASMKVFDRLLDDLTGAPPAPGGRL